MCYLLLIRDAGRAQVNLREQTAIRLSKQLLKLLPGEEIVNTPVKTLVSSVARYNMTKHNFFNMLFIAH